MVTSVSGTSVSTVDWRRKTKFLNSNSIILLRILFHGAHESINKFNKFAIHHFTLRYFAHTIKWICDIQYKVIKRNIRSRLYPQLWRWRFFMVHWTNVLIFHVFHGEPWFFFNKNFNDFFHLNYFSNFIRFNFNDFFKFYFNKFFKFYFNVFFKF